MNDELICHCFNIKESEIIKSIKENGVRSFQDFSRYMKADRGRDDWSPDTCKRTKESGG